MKINIYTMHRIINYGSILQAYALKRELESHKDVECFFTDYKPEKKFVRNYIIQLIRPMVLLIKNKIRTKDNRKSFIKKRNLNFLTKYQKVLGISNIPNYDYNADVSVIGSDEVFNVCQNSLWKGSMHYFGSKITYGKIYSYAGSFGSTSLQSLENEDLSYQIQNCLKRFNGLSVRDTNSEIILKKLSNKVILRNLDPVFIYPFTDEVKEIELKDYVIVYGYDDRMHEQNLIDNLKTFCKEHGKMIISIGGYQEWCDKNIAPDPFEVLGYFKNADYIVTDTFHGTVLSIKYQKKFATIVRSQNKEKLSDLLTFFELTDRIVDETYSNIKQILLEKYDYESVIKKIENERVSARNYFNIICDTSDKFKDEG